MNSGNDSSETKIAVEGATTDTVDSVTAVSTTGASVGLGVTGITSGLAAVGSIAGGGMVTGLAITAAAPLAVGAIGAAAYGLYKWLKD